MREPGAGRTRPVDATRHATVGNPTRSENEDVTGFIAIDQPSNGGATGEVNSPSRYREVWCYTTRSGRESSHARRSDRWGYSVRARYTAPSGAGERRTVDPGRVNDAGRSPTRSVGRSGARTRRGVGSEAIEVAVGVRSAVTQVRRSPIRRVRSVGRVPDPSDGADPIDAEAVEGRNCPVGGSNHAEAVGLARSAATSPSKLSPVRPLVTSFLAGCSVRDLNPGRRLERPT